MSDWARVKGSLQYCLFKIEQRTVVMLILYSKAHHCDNILLKMCLLVSMAVKVINYD